MRTTEIRRKFLNYFATNDHQIVASSSLVPENDPTLLFVNAGMVQFKDLFLGLEKRPYQRATTSQRCVRAGGKHNDLENVGYTARHHTFFEMLGNFSFGDYFKQEAIHMAWEFLTVELQLPAEKLWVTVFEEDDEAADIWLRQIGIPQERFARIGAHDNFWAMGDTGPCGPCSEIFYDHGPSVAGGPPGSPDEDGDRYVEIWNLVFMQFNRSADGHMEPLPKPSVDTGMGLERLATVLQGVHNNYDIDLFKNLVAAAGSVVDSDDLENKSLRVIADHIRSTSFLIADGVTPSNEGRGYVLRRIIRRAIRHGYQLGCKKPFLHEIVPALVQEMGEAYPELRDAESHVARVLQQEGEKFSETLDVGIAIIDGVIKDLDAPMIPGDVVFKLYDTYGFPVDLTADVAREQGLSIDLSGFEIAMEAQRQRARAASQFSGGEQQLASLIDTASEFLGYGSIETGATVLEIARSGSFIDTAGINGTINIVLDRTPFYAESGGQVGDRGELSTAHARLEVLDTQKLTNDVIIHIARVLQGEIKIGDSVSAHVNGRNRDATAANHSATHLLHAALQQELGEHVQQKGSLVEAGRLRFDFSHNNPLTADQIRVIERMVNRQVRANLEVTTEILPLQEARDKGAAALFGEKYSDRVRVVGMGKFSCELCGGTHVNRTGDIGLFKIIVETGIAAGVRRIEAITAEVAETYVEERLQVLDQTARLLKVKVKALPEKARSLSEQSRSMDREIQQLKSRLAVAGPSEAADPVREIKGVKVLALRCDGMNAKTLRSAMDAYRQKIGSGVVVLASVDDGKAKLAASISEQWTDRLHAGKLIEALSSAIDGRGGGKANMAQGGGTNIGALDAALDGVGNWVEERL